MRLYSHPAQPPPNDQPPTPPWRATGPRLPPPVREAPPPHRGRVSRYATKKNANRTCCDPPGSESMTCRLQEVRPHALCALAAPMARIIALAALAALGLSCAPFHEPFHVGARQSPVVVVQRSGRDSRYSDAQPTMWSDEVRTKAQERGPICNEPAAPAMGPVHRKNGRNRRKMLGVKAPQPAPLPPTSDG